MILILALVSNITLQPFYYTNIDFMYELSVYNGMLYTATNGGMVATSLMDGSYTVLTNTDGLQVNRQVCCAIDSSGYIWCGNELGLALINPAFTEATAYPEHIINSYVQDIVCLPESVYVGSPAGLLFIMTQGTIEDFDDDVQMRLYIQNGLLSDNIQTIAVLDDHVWVGTDQGITRFVKSFHPDSFEQYTTAQGLLSNNITSIEIIQDTVYVATGQGLNAFNGVTFDTLVVNEEVGALTYLGDSLILALDTLHQIGIYYQGTFSYATNNLPYKCRIMDVLHESGTVYCGLGSRWSVDRHGEGLGVFDPVNNAWEITTYNCLPSNHIAEIEANTYGIFCALGARRSHSLGIGWLHENGYWDNFTRDSILPSNNIHRCTTAPDGCVWFGVNSFSGSGADTIMLVSYDVDQDLWQFIPRRFLNIDNSVAVWDIEFDRENNLYVALAGPSDKLWVINANLDSALSLGTEREGFNIEIAIDSAHAVWRSVFGDAGAVLMADTKGTVFDHTDDEYRTFQESDGLLSKYVYGCLVDRNNILYLANNTGLLEYDGAFHAFTNITSGEIFDVTLDTEGRIWMAARSGIYYYDPALDIINGWEYYQLGIHIQFLEFSNEAIQLQAFEFDSLRNCIWIGGETGLLQLSISQDTFVALDSIIIYPNPAVSVSAVKIKNLPSDARVRIYSISGRSMCEELLPDRVFNEVVWNIPDDAASGMYFAVISTDQGSKVCKFAIVR